MSLACIIYHQFNSLFPFIFQAAKAADAARKKNERGGGIGVPDAGIDDDDILALSAVSPGVSFAKACVTCWQAIDAANGRASGGAAAPVARAASNPWERDRKDALKEALKAKVRVQSAC